MSEEGATWWIVVEPAKPSGTLTLSRRYQVKEAAEEFLRLARPDHPDAYLKPIYGKSG